VLSRPMRDRKAVARYAGLTGSPDESGAKRREQAINQAVSVQTRRYLAGSMRMAWPGSSRDVMRRSCQMAL
jgi:transposase